MKICVIGAGSSGLTAIKACREEGMEVDCFEMSDDFGGLWRYHDDNLHGKPSVMKTTVINTSKEMSAFSDFPPPKEFANFMHNRYMLEYFRLYAEKFDLLQHIRYACKVVTVEMAGDYKATGRWYVAVQNLQNGSVLTDVYDGVMVCTGHHAFPHWPSFEGLEDFRGGVTHTHSVKSEKGFDDKKVLIIGIGNSAVDAATELCKVTKMVYLSTRRGSWIFSRKLFGFPIDMFLSNRLFSFIQSLDVLNITNYLMELLINLQTDHDKFMLRPKHRVMEAHPTISDALPTTIMTGQVILKQDVQRFCRTGVIFEGEDAITEIDDVILATGYEIKFPFLSDDVLQVRSNSSKLYKLVFPANLPHPSLAFIGYIQPRGCIFPIAEAQSRWYAQLMKGALYLPCKTQMMAEVERRQENISKRYVNSQRHTIQVDFIPYLDEICEQFGAKPRLWTLAIKDPRLFCACILKPCVPYQYRLQGPHRWDGARHAILTSKDRFEYPFKTCKPFK